MVKILFCTHAYPPYPGGVSSFSKDLVDLLKSMQYEVVLLKDQYPLQNETCEESEKRTGILKARALHFYRLFRVLRCVLIFRPDLLVVTDWRQFGLGAMLIRLCMSIPYVLQVHGSEITERYLKGFRRVTAGLIFKYAACVMPNSSFTRQLVIDTFSREFCQRIIRPFISPNLERQLLEAKLRKACRKSRQHQVGIVCVGSLTKRKGFDVVIKALARVRELSWYCTIIGSGPCAQELKALCDKVGLSQKIKFTGQLPRNEVIQIMSEADVFILTSRQLPDDIESFGIVYIEAQYLGLPCIANPIYGVPEAVFHGEGGLWVQQDELVSSTASAIKKLLGDGEFRTRQGQMGQQRISLQFSAMRRSEELGHLIEQALIWHNN